MTDRLEKKSGKQFNSTHTHSDTHTYRHTHYMVINLRYCKKKLKDTPEDRKNSHAHGSE